MVYYVLLYLKLEKGIYLIDGIGNIYQEKGIIISSNITFDLNSSTLKHVKNDQIRYTVISVYNVQNVTIMNGIIEGDKVEHNYNNINSTHEWGYAIEVCSSKNIKLTNLEIKNTTGDGIIITQQNGENTRECEEILIENCNIHECRRQGISIICGKNIKIRENEIHDIEGTNPQSAIDLEPNNNEEEINNIEIYDNKLYNLGGSFAICMRKNINQIKITNNEINGNISIRNSNDYVYIANNEFDNGQIYIDLEENGFDLNKVIIKSNLLENSSVYARECKDVIVENNNITNKFMQFYSCNVAIYKNNFIRDENATLEYCCLYDLKDDEENKEYTIYSYGNQKNERYLEIQRNLNNEKIHIISDEEIVKHYIERKSEI